MITVNAEGERLGLCFSHPVLTGKKGTTRASVCEIYSLKEDGARGEMLGFNETICSRQDNFNKKIGRKIALSRALCQHNYWLNPSQSSNTCTKCGSYLTPSITLSKELRSKIWDTYFQAIQPQEDVPTEIVAALVAELRVANDFIAHAKAEHSLPDICCPDVD